MTKQDIISLAGGLDAIAKRVGVKAPSARVMLSRGLIPASWYFALCDMTGQPLPRHLFSFKGLTQ
jgi:hypothetical protein